MTDVVLSESLLVVGRDDYICRKICERLNNDRREVFTIGFEVPKYSKTFPWNRNSYISTKTVCREIIRKVGVPKETFIIFGPHYEESFPNLSTQKIDEIIDDEFKSIVHLVQELCRKIFSEGVSASIYFVYIRSNDPRQQLSRAVGIALKIYAQVLMEGDLSPYFLGFELDGYSHDTDGFIEYIVKITSEHSEKKRNSWLLYPKPGFFFGKH